MAIPSLQPGTILVEAGTSLPDAMCLQQGAPSGTWRPVSNPDGVGLQARLTTAGWTLFYMAGAIHRRAFGFDEAQRVNAAVAGIISDVRHQNCNSLEITHVATKAFLGIPYVSITAHARHIQDGCQFRGR